MIDAYKEYVAERRERAAASPEELTVRPILTERDVRIILDLIYLYGKGAVETDKPKLFNLKTKIESALTDARNG